MRPSPVLCKRLKTRVSFTTKQVGKGFYRGTGAGSMGAHTPSGGYVIDWRKVRHYVVPDLSANKFTPYVSGSKQANAELPRDQRGNPYDPTKIDGMQFLKWWKMENPEEYDYYLDQEDQLQPQNSEEAQNETQQDQPTIVQQSVTHTSQQEQPR